MLNDEDYVSVPEEQSILSFMEGIEQKIVHLSTELLEKLLFSWNQDILEAG